MPAAAAFAAVIAGGVVTVTVLLALSARVWAGRLSVRPWRGVAAAPDRLGRARVAGWATGKTYARCGGRVTLPDGAAGECGQPIRQCWHLNGILCTWEHADDGPYGPRGSHWHVNGDGSRGSEVTHR